MRSKYTRAIAFHFLAAISRGAVDYMKLDPCKLVCHMQHTIDKCKLVKTTPDTCTNLHWVDDSRRSVIIDRLPDQGTVPVKYSDTLAILKVGKNGCDALCDSHDACTEIGSECKVSGVCLNLFWNRGSPSRIQMTSCYELSTGGCDDGTPILCGDEADPVRLNDITDPSTGSPTAARNNNSSGSGVGEENELFKGDSSSSAAGGYTGENEDELVEASNANTNTIGTASSSAASSYVSLSFLVIPVITRF